MILELSHLCSKNIGLCALNNRKNNNKMDAKLTQAHQLIQDHQQVIYRLVMLLFGSILSLMLLFNLLNTNASLTMAQPTQVIADLFNSAVSSIISHNMTTTPDTQTIQQTLPPPTKIQLSHDNNIQTITIATGLTIADIFKQSHLDTTDLQKILALPQAYKILSKLQQGQSIELQTNWRRELLSLRYPFNPNNTLVVYRDNGGYKAEVINNGLEERLVNTAFSIHQSLFDAAKQAGFNARLRVQLANIFDSEINFSHDIKPGAKLEVLYQEYYKGGQRQHAGNIVAVEFDNNGHIYQAIRHVSSNGDVGYYTPTGENMQKAFIRAPVHYKYISSPFALHRRHPILHIVRPHYGVDLAAKRGTPIHASSDGEIIFIGRKGGYGNVIKIKNGRIYTTVYAHMEHFAKGLKRGIRVHKGEVIGYVGMTGLATGPHLHYEFRINGHPVNPMTVNLPNGKPIAKKQLKQFEAYAKITLAKLT